MLLFPFACATAPDPVDAPDLSIDSDGDGFTDGEELDCGADPDDVGDTCYACGWSRSNDDLGPTGAGIGDTILDLELYDQCGDALSLHDFAGGWRILFGTAAWCSVCLDEARSLDQHTQDFVDETGIEFSWMVLLFADTKGDAPGDDVAGPYAEEIGDPSIPVVADPMQGFLYDTPYDGSELPGKCLLSPDLEIRMCWAGPGNDDAALDIVRAEGVPQ